jgi:hypothetical protein
MDHELFDSLVRRLSAGLTRRGAVGSALGGLAAAAGLAARPVAEAKKGKGKTATGKAKRHSRSGAPRSCVRDPKTCEGKPCDALDNCGTFCGCSDQAGVCCSDGICRVPPTCSPNGESGLCCSGHQCGNGTCCAAGNSLASSIVVDVDVFNAITVNTPPTTVTVTINPVAATTTPAPGGAGRRRRRRRKHHRRRRNRR